MSGQPPSSSYDEFKRQFAAHLEEEAGEPQGSLGIPDEALLWMALAEDWTLPLARAVSFPSGDSDVADVLNQMHQAGLFELCRSRSTAAEPGRSVYTMTGIARADVLKPYLDSPEGLAKLRSALTRVGTAILLASRKLRSVSVQLRRWATLAARANDSSRMAAVFERRIDAAFNANNSADVLNWIAVARPLTLILTHDLDRSMEFALQQASRRLELLYRRDADRQHLRLFLRRDDQIAAYEELMSDGRDALWALHFRGAGGTGKTMLIRHITAELAPRQKVVTARIDFDYLSADYPRSAPGLMLWAFAQELRAHGDEQVNIHLGRAEEVLQDLHRRLQSDRASARAIPPTRDPTFAKALALYIDSFRAIGRPILLIVDTCEELTKARIGAGASDSVDETFRVLRALHDGPDTLADDNAPPSGGLPNLRVIFAGRRPLAGRGAGWRDPSCALTPRPYLRLHEIRGFTSGEAPAYHGEARAYLAKAGAPEALIPPVIGNIQRMDGPSPIEWDEPSDRPERVQRCNPYELRIYAEWIRQAEPSPEEIEGTSPFQYVELRIIERLGSPALEDLLPIVALLGHVDLEMLQAVCGGAQQAQEIFHALRQQEWVNQRAIVGGPEGASQEVLDLEPGMQRRLLSYFEQRLEGVTPAQRRVADLLEERTLKRDLSALDWSFFDAALRVLEQTDPRRAARWWDAVEARILAERDARWALEPTRAIQSDDGAAAEDDAAVGPGRRQESRLRPAVLATYAAALLHSGLLGDLPNVWQEVAQKADAHPIPAAAGRLQLRALAGIVATARYAQARPRQADVEQLWRTIDTRAADALDPQIAAALVAAAEALIEQAEQLADDDPAAARALLAVPAPDREPILAAPTLGVVRLAEILTTACEGWQTQMPERAQAFAELLAFASALAGRAQAVTGAYAAAAACFAQALKCTEKKAPLEQRAEWADWLPPDDVDARVRLEFNRAICPASQPEAVTSWKAAPNTIDSERLHSSILRWRLARGIVPLDALAPLGWFDLKSGSPIFREAGLVPGAAGCNAHNQVPPLFVTVAEVIAATGLVDQALPQLRYVSTQITRFDPETVRHAERELLRIVRRMRLRDEGEGGGESLGDQSAADQALIWALDGLDGAKNQRLTPPLPSEQLARPARQLWLHHVWRACYARDADEALQAAQWARVNLAPAAALGHQPAWLPSFPQASLNLDLREAWLLAAISPESAGLVSGSGLHFDPLSWWQSHPDRPEEALRLLLRSRALGASTGEVSQAPDDLVERLGRRLSAEIALDEGELLALRLPGWSLPILSQARSWFEACDDPVGIFLASANLALIHVRRAAYDELSATLAQARQAYEQIRMRQRAAGDGVPPEWERLEQLAQEPTDAALDSLAPRCWRPWLVRMIACMSHLRRLRDERASASAEVLLRWLRKHYGMVTQDIVELPADFDGWLDEPLHPADRLPAAVLSPHTAEGRHAEPSLGERARLSQLGKLLSTTFSTNEIRDLIHDMGVEYEKLEGRDKKGKVRGLIDYVRSHARISELRRAIARLRPDVLWGEEQAPSHTLAEGLAGLPSGGKPLLVLRVFPAQGAPASAGSPTDIQPIGLSLTLQDQGGQRTLLGAMAGQSKSPGLASYQQLVADLPNELVDDLRHLDASLAARTLELVVEPAEGLHGPCWEALVALAVKGQRQLPRDLPFRFIRRATDSRSPRSLARTKAPQLITWATSDLAAAMATRGWAPLRSEPRFDIQVRRAESLAGLSATPERVRILHLIGTADETYARVRFRLAGEPATRAIQNIQQSLEESRPAHLLKAKEVARTFPNLAICVIQGEPGRLASGRLEGERRDAILARVFAADLFAQGVPVVLVLPSLEPALAVSALEPVAEAIRDFILPGTDAFLEVVAEMQSRIVERSGADAEAAWELALDVCMYAFENWDGQIS